MLMGWGEQSPDLNRKRGAKISRRHFVGSAAAAAFSPLLSSGFAASGTASARRADVVIYGGTPAGLTAAAACSREGVSVIVAEPTSQIGGMISGGIAVTDTQTPRLVGGLAAEFFQAAGARSRALASGSEPPSIIFHGRRMAWNPYQPWDLNPSVARQVFAEWVQHGQYQVLTRRRVVGVEKDKKRIQAIRLSDGATLSGKVFIDASYEGDLLARAGVDSTYGRESVEEYGENLAGRRAPYFVRNYFPETYRTPGWVYMHKGQFGADIPARRENGRLLAGVEEAPRVPVGGADQRVQSYCFRLIVTQRDDLKVPWPRPERYDPARYELLRLYIQAHPGMCFSRLVHFGSIPNGKFDFNASGPFSTDYIGGNNGFPDLDYDARDRMIRDHEDYQKGFLWFLACDPAVPQGLRDEVNTWGLCKDEGAGADHWPVQLYIREARRMKGEYVMTEHDILRNVAKEDSVGLGSFVLDSHWVQRFANEAGYARVEGHLDETIDLRDHPYEIPYRSLIPKSAQCENLLVPVCLSASHVAFCTIRMEPVYMLLGHSAGVAGALAAKAESAVQQIDMPLLLRKLREQRQVLHRPVG